MKWTRSFHPAGVQPVGPALAGNTSGVTPQNPSALTGLFPAEAGPTKTLRALWGTDWSPDFVKTLRASTGLGGVPTRRTGFSRKTSGVTPQNPSVLTGLFPAEAGPTETLCALRGTDWSPDSAKTLRALNGTGCSAAPHRTCFSRESRCGSGAWKCAGRNVAINTVAPSGALEPT
jgi:hypothetical protein